MEKSNFKCCDPNRPGEPVIRGEREIHACQGVSVTSFCRRTGQTGLQVFVVFGNAFDMPLKKRKEGLLNYIGAMAISHFEVLRCLITWLCEKSSSVSCKRDVRLTG